MRADGAGACSRADGGGGRRAVALLARRYPQQRAAGAVLAVDVERWSGDRQLLGLHIVDLVPRDRADTVPCTLPRTEYAEAIVWSRAFWL